MTAKIWMNSLANSQEDVLQQFLDLLKELCIDYCVLGGLAVNAYVEPVVSLDLDIVVADESLEKLTQAAKKMFQIKKIPNSLNLKSSKSDFRIQLQTDPRYQPFIPNAALRKVIGYEMKVAALENVLQGKLWTYSDEQRRKSKRQKDLADIFRLVEAYPHLERLLPDELKM